jgi:hypothetical protein
VSSAGNTRHRLNLRGNRILNHAIHIAAVTQLRHDTNGRVYFDKKIAEGNTTKEATPYEFQAASPNPEQLALWISHSRCDKTHLAPLITGNMGG